jgi:hypothetical protein
VKRLKEMAVKNREVSKKEMIRPPSNKQFYKSCQQISLGTGQMKINSRLFIEDFITVAGNL